VTIHCTYCGREVNTSFGCSCDERPIRPIEKHEWKVWKEKCEKLQAENKELRKQLHAHHEYGRSGPTKLLVEILKVEKLEKERDELKAEVESLQGRRNHEFCFATEKELRDQCEKLAAALGKVKQLEVTELNDTKTVLKKHNIMAMFASEALAEYQKFKQGDK